MLTKISTVTGDPGTPDIVIPGTPGSPGKPGKPGYCVTVGYQEVIDGGKLVYIPPNGPNPGQWVLTGATKKRVPIVVCYPPEPPVPPVPPTPTKVIKGRPSTLVTDYHFGWNAGAISRIAQPYHCRLTFACAPSTIGVVVGLNNQSTGQGYKEIQHAIYCNEGKAQIVEEGVVCGVQVQYVDGDDFQIVRLGSKVFYQKNNVTFYTSQKRSAGTLIVDASLYSGGDKIQ